MKTKSLLIFFAFIFVSAQSFGQKSEDKQTEFAQAFTEAVGTKNYKKTLKFLDKTYRKEQLAFLDGNKEQLANELFGGSDLADLDTYINMKISEIDSIELLEVIPLKGSDTCNCLFKLKKGDVEIMSSLQLIKKGKKYGFVGGLG